MDNTEDGCGAHPSFFGLDFGDGNAQAKKPKSNDGRSCSADGKQRSTQAKATPKLKSKAAASKKHAKAGRPKKDRVDQANKLVVQFENIKGEHYCPMLAEYATYTRLALALRADFQRELDQIEDANEHDSVTVEIMKTRTCLKKQMHVIHQILTSWAKAGSFTKAFVDTISECEQFLNLEPVAKLALPPYFLRQKLDILVDDAKPEQFWSLCNARSLVESGCIKGDDDPCPALLELMVNKITTIAKLASDPLDAQTKLQAFFAPGASKALGDASAMAQAKIIETMLHGSSDLDLLRECAAATKNEKYTVVAALSAYANGRQIVSNLWSSIAVEESGRKLLADIDKTVPHLKNLANDILKDPSNADWSNFMAALKTFATALSQLPKDFSKEWCSQDSSKQKIADISTLTLGLIGADPAIIKLAFVEGEFPAQTLALVASMQQSIDFKEVGGFRVVTAINEFFKKIQRLSGFKGGDALEFDEAAALLTCIDSAALPENLVDAIPGLIKESLEKEAENHLKSDAILKCISTCTDAMMPHVKGVAEHITKLSEVMADWKEFSNKECMTSFAKIVDLSESVEALIPMSNKVGDIKFAEQLVFTKRLIEILPQIAKFNAAFEDSKTKSPADLATALTSLAQRLRIFSMTDSQKLPSLRNIFEEVGSASFPDPSHRMTNLDTLIDAKVVRDSVCSKSMEFLRAVVKQWEGDAMVLIASIKDCSPVGWLRDRLLDQDEEAASMRSLLVNNASYNKLGPAVTDLSALRRSLAGLRMHDGPQLVDVRTLDDAKKTVLQGIECVTYTFLIWTLLTKAPKIKDLEVRKAVLESAESTSCVKLGVKGLPPKFSKHIKALKNGTDPYKEGEPS